MSDYIRILCNSTEMLSSSEIIGFILEGAYFDDSPAFDPPQEAAEPTLADWRTLAVSYQAGKRPIIFHRSVNDQLMRTEVEEIIEEELADKQTEAAETLRRRLSRCHQTLAIEINPTSLTEEAWEMLDSIEAYLAEKYQGVVYVPDDGFFDEALQGINVT